MNKRYIFVGIIFFICFVVYLVWINEEVELKKKSMTPKKTIDSAKDKDFKIKKNLPYVTKENEKFLESYYNDLPNNEDFNGLTESEIHNTPIIVFRGAEIISSVLRAGDKDKAKRKPALEFLKKCAEDSKIINSMRALCLKQVYHFIQIWNEPISIKRELISKDVEQITEKML